MDNQDRVDLLNGRLPRKRNYFAAICEAATSTLRELTAEAAGSVPLPKEARDGYTALIDILPATIRDAFLDLEADRVELYALENPAPEPPQ